MDSAQRMSAVRGGAGLFGCRLFGDDQILDFVVGGFGKDFFSEQVGLGVIRPAVNNFLRVCVANTRKASSWALVAEFKSTRLALAGAAAEDCAVAEWLCDKTGTERTNSSDAASTKNEKLCFRFMNALLFECEVRKM